MTTSWVAKKLPGPVKFSEKRPSLGTRLSRRRATTSGAGSVSAGLVGRESASSRASAGSTKRDSPSREVRLRIASRTAARASTLPTASLAAPSSAVRTASSSPADSAPPRDHVCLRTASRTAARASARPTASLAAPSSAVRTASSSPAAPAPPRDHVCLRTASRTAARTSTPRTASFTTPSNAPRTALETASLPPNDSAAASRPSEPRARCPPDDSGVSSRGPGAAPGLLVSTGASSGSPSAAHMKTRYAGMGSHARKPMAA